MEIYYHFALYCAALGLLFAMLLVLSRLLRGPTLYDRILAVNAFGSKTVVFLCLFSFLIGRADGVDIAILYALINFISTIAVLKFFRYRSLDIALANTRYSMQSLKENQDSQTVSESSNSESSNPDLIDKNMSPPMIHKRKD